MASVAQDGDFIFLLGDLFEAWVGDDYSNPIAKRFAKSCRNASDVGSVIYLMQGNRDFLMGDTFAQECNAELLSDPEFMRVDAQTVLLTHGDSFCTDDKAYQQFKAQSRSPKWQEHFLAKPIEERLAIAAHIRGESKRQSHEKAAEIMDVNAKAVANTYAGKWPEGYFVGRTDVIIHGHTHRCAVHSDQTENKTGLGSAPCGKLEYGLRVVLPDWQEPIENKPAKGGFLTVNGTGDYTLTRWL